MEKYTCINCGRLLLINEFYDEKSKRGHTRKCKDCLREYRRKWSRDNPGKVEANRIAYKQRHAEKERERRAANPGKVKEINMRVYQNNREKYKTMVAEYRRKFPEREHAHNILKSAIRSGKILKPEYCEICGKKANLQGHHDDYNRPLDVFWLCGNCHSLLHKGKYDTAHRIASDLGITLKET